MSAAKLEGWDALQAPFDAESVSLLPRYTGPKDANGKPTGAKAKCAECGGYHTMPSIHLSYVGHADITMRLNEVDPEWTWEPMGLTPEGLPALDANGGLWAWLNILGSRKPAYGDPGLDYKQASKKGTPDGMKEAIGDMLRNGAMRFGVGTALWSKSDKAKATLYADDDAPASKPTAGTPSAQPVDSGQDGPIAPKYERPAASFNDGEDFTMTIGKFKGQTLREIAKHDLSYIAWVADKYGFKDGVENPKYAAANEKVRKLAADIHGQEMLHPSDPAIAEPEPVILGDDDSIPF